MTLQSLVPHLSCKRLTTKASTGLVRAPSPSPLSPQAVTVNVCDFRRVPVVTLLCTFPEGALRQDSCVRVLRQRIQLNFHRHRLPKTKWLAATWTESRRTQTYYSMFGHRLRPFTPGTEQNNWNKRYMWWGFIAQVNAVILYVKTCRGLLFSFLL